MLLMLKCHTNYGFHELFLFYLEKSRLFEEGGRKGNRSRNKIH